AEKTVNVGGGVPDAPQADADSAPYNLPHGRGRACPARGLPAGGRLPYSCGPHMCDPYNLPFTPAL
uniref:hypothetical protein n=1 Tax=Gemmiger formicilis TaxID=745368 RepID=UPI0040268EBC